MGYDDKIWLWVMGFQSFTGNGVGGCPKSMGYYRLWGVTGMV